MIFEKHTPVLLSWKGGFTLAHLTDYQPRQILLELRGLPEPHGGHRWLIVARRTVGQPPQASELIWKLRLPVRTEIAARMVLAEICTGLEAKRQPAPPAGGGEAPPLFESQLRFLARRYPRTIAVLRALSQAATSPARSQPGKTLAAIYAEEFFAQTGEVLEPVTDGEVLLRLSQLHANAQARKRKLDPVEYELIVGCSLKGYYQMPFPALQAAIRRATGCGVTTEVLRQKWKRLALPSRRRRGRPPVRR